MFFSVSLICIVKIVRKVYVKTNPYNIVILDNLANTFTLSQMFHFVGLWFILNVILKSYAPYYVYLIVRSIYFSIVQFYPYFANPALRCILNT